MYRPSLIINPIVDQDLDVLSDKEECISVQVVVEMSSKSLKKKKKKNLQHHCERETNLSFFSAGNYFYYFGYKKLSIAFPSAGTFQFST